MANYKKKNGNRKRSRLHGFRNMKIGRGGDTWRLDSVRAKYVRAFLAVEEV